MGEAASDNDCNRFRYYLRQKSASPSLAPAATWAKPVIKNTGSPNGAVANSVKQDPVAPSTRRQRSLDPIDPSIMGDFASGDGHMRFHYDFRRKSSSPSPAPAKRANPGTKNSESSKGAVTDSVKPEPVAPSACRKRSIVDPSTMGDAAFDDIRMQIRYDFRRKLASPSPAPAKRANPAAKNSVSPNGAVDDSVQQESVAKKSKSPNGAVADSAKKEPLTQANDQMPRRHLSRMRVLAVRNYSAGYGSGAGKDRSHGKRKLDKEAEEPQYAIHDQDLDVADARLRVNKALAQYDLLYKELQPNPQADTQAFTKFKERNKELVGRRKHIGSVLGVEIGDEFGLRVELCVVGIHCQHRMIVDYIDQDGKLIALSLVYSRPYAKDITGCDVFEFPSSGDLKVHGNLALKNSMDVCIPVRVIYGFEGYPSDKRETKNKSRNLTYVYDGVFSVEKYWRKKGTNGKYLCMFQFKRMSTQAELKMKGIKAIEIEYNKHLVMKDISQGEERIPIPVVNVVNDEQPIAFKYTRVMMYPPQHSLPPPRGCDCSNGCSDSESCACAVKNGGELPFNERGDIVETKPLVIECGPSCKCPPSCHNRVMQNGIKFRLEVFKTESRGWGVRSRDPIPTGSFICECTGVLLDDKVANKNANDEYLFNIGDNLYDEALWEGLKPSIPGLKRDAPSEDDDVNFVVDALEYGNVGRFVNHSCTPNLFAQNLLFDHDNKKMPHVAFFAQDDIKPMEELTFHYNYAIDGVCDSDGNIKKKDCYCGSSECTGRMY